MNERIKELALHAGFAYEPNKDQLWVDGPTEIMISPGLEKFAQLIVRECAQVSEDDITDGDACCSNTADRIARQIKKHFGVEE